MSIYSELILDHYQNPRNLGRIKNATGSIHVSNPLCGDKIEMTVDVEKGRIRDIKFEGVGCAVSTASSSMLTEYAKSRKVKDLKKIDQKFMIELLGIKLGVNRIKCALLPLEALHKLLSSQV